MTDRTTRLTVALDGPYRTDDVQPIMDAIQHIKGVLSVGYEVQQPSDWVAYEQARLDLRTKIWNALSGKES